MKKDMNTLISLYAKPSSYDFSPEELNFIKEHNPIDSFVLRYSVYKSKSEVDVYIGVFVDSIRKGNFVDRSKLWQVVCERSLSQKEYDYIIKRFRGYNKGFEAWYYQNIEALIQNELRFNIRTPGKFIDFCKKMGYTVSSGSNGNDQMTLEF